MLNHTMLRLKDLVSGFSVELVTGKRRVDLRLPFLLAGIFLVVILFNTTAEGAIGNNAEILEADSFVPTVMSPGETRQVRIVVKNTGNTTWFESYNDNSDIYMITDFEGDLLIKDYNFTYPLRIYNLSRAEINYDQKKAKKIKQFYELE